MKNYFKIDCWMRWLTAIAAAMFLLPLGGCRGQVEALPPDCPDEITAEAQGVHAICVQWQSMERATGYIALLESEDAENLGEGESFQLRTETCKAVFEGLKADTTYRVTVVSLYEERGQTLETDSSKPVSVYTAAPTVGEVKGLTATAIGNGSFSVSWQPYLTQETNADGSPAQVTYTLYTNEKGTDFLKEISQNQTETSYQDAATAFERSYKVCAVVTVDGKPFVGQPSELVTAVQKMVTASPTTGTTGKTTVKSSTTSVPRSTSKTTVSTTNAAAAKREQARVIAQQIADSIGPGTDLERVSRAAAIVSEYSQRATYTTEGSDYCEAYGVFIKGEYSCAGSTRALGMVLSCMGYSWKHMNENQWTHQWCVLEMDGQIGFADGQVGWAGYGSHPVAGN